MGVAPAPNSAGSVHKGSPRREFLAWIIVVAVAALLMAAVDVQAVDADSGLHIGLVVRLSAMPLDQWIAPQWWGMWGLTGPYREHPIGILVLPLLLHKLGYPAAQAPFLANAIYQVLSLIVIQRVAASVVSGSSARSLIWMLQLIPIAFTYRIRANHEQAVLLLFFLALWAVEKSRKDSRWIGLLMFSAAATVLVKGLFVAWIFIGCGAWLLIVRGEGDGSPLQNIRARAIRDIHAWIGLAAALGAVVAVIACYEFFYNRTTQESFLATYTARQIETAASAEGLSSPSKRARNLVFYGGRLLWFAFPGSIAVLALMRRHRNDKSSTALMRQALFYCVGVSILYVLMFSLSDRHADRYIFPAYYLLAAGGMIVAIHRWDWVRRVAERWDRRDVLSPLLWIVLFSLNLASGPSGLPRIEL